MTHLIDHEINSIQDYMADDISERYQMVHVLAERIFHTGMRLTEFDLNDYLFAENAADLTQEQAGEITGIFYGRNAN